ncbi:MAG: hypothetical protein AABM33_05120 [Pseudomonadota bacterium]
MILSGSLSCRAEDFVFEVAAPKFKVTIPSIPQMRMDIHPKNPSQPHLRFLGSEEPYTIAVFTPAAAAGMTPLECASAIIRSLAARPGTPPSSQVFKARLNDNTFVAIYAAPLGAGVQLHAHFLSAAGGTHCIEVHATKISILEDDLASWITDVEKASIEPN